MNDMEEMLCMKTCKLKIMLDCTHEYEDVRCPRHGDTIEHSKTLIQRLSEKVRLGNTQQVTTLTIR